MSFVKLQYHRITCIYITRQVVCIDSKFTVVGLCDKNPRWILGFKPFVDKEFF